MMLRMLHVLDQTPKHKNYFWPPKQWRVHSACNHSTANTDQWNRPTSGRTLANQANTVVRPRNALQHLRESQKIPTSPEKVYACTQISPRTGSRQKILEKNVGLSPSVIADAMQPCSQNFADIQTFSATDKNNRTSAQLC